MAAILEAAGNILPKPLIDNISNDTVSPMLFVFVTYCINGIIFSMTSKKSIGLLYHHSKRKIWYALTIIGIVEVLSTVFYLYGLQRTSATNAILLENSEILFGVLIAVFFLHERIHKKEIFPIILILVGTIFLPLSVDVLHISDITLTNFIVGDILVLISAILLGIVVCLYKKISQNVDVRLIIGYTSMVGAFVAAVLLIILQISIQFDFEQLTSMVLIGAIGVGLPAFFFVIALKYIGAIHTILVFSSTALFGIIFSNIILGELISPSNWLSVALLIAGTFFIRKIITE